MSDSKKNLSVERKFLGLLVLVLLLTLASGTIYGRLTQRWGPSANLLAAADHVRNFPKQVGPWRLLNENDMPDDTQRVLECAGYVNRQYVHDQTGQSIGMAIIVGPPGPTAVHTPEICYSSVSYTVIESPRAKLVPEQDDSFWGIRFRSRHAGGDQLQVYYAWSNGQRWEATKNPRIRFGGNRLLHKVQVSGGAGLEFGEELADPAWDFVVALAASPWTPYTTELYSN